MKKRKEEEKYKSIEEIPSLSSKSKPYEIKEFLITSTIIEIKENIPTSTPETQLIKCFSTIQN